MVDFFPPNFTNLGDLREPMDRKLRPETKFDNYAVHNWDQRDPTAAADIKSQLDNVIISKDMFDPDRALPRQPNLTDEDVTVAFDDDLGFIRGLGADATLDYDADDGADSDDGSKPKRKKAAKQKDDGGKEKSSKPAPKPAAAKGSGKGKGKTEEQTDDSDDAVLQGLKAELANIEAEYGGRGWLDDNEPYAAAVVAAMEGESEVLQQAILAARSMLEDQDRANDD